MATAIALTDPPVRQVERGKWIRLSVGTALGVALCWLAGFGWFLYSATRDAPPAPHVDAIVVLTGGPDRVEVAFRLLAEGAADRLLVSGTGTKTDLAVLAHRAGIDPAPLEQQITLGHAAHSTHGNALETASWVRDQGIGTLLVVTSWFHMPRAILEFRRAMPGVVAQPYPVGRLETAALTHGGEARRVIGEYHKYLAALAGLTASPFVLAAWGTGSAK